MSRFPVTIIWMSVHLKKFLLVAVLLGVPLQGAAATLASMLCDPGAQMHEIPVKGGNDRHTHQDGDQDKGYSDGNFVWHPFHGTVLGGVAVTLLAPAQDIPFWALAPDTPYDLFIPERPQRPPLA